MLLTPILLSPPDLFAELQACMSNGLLSYLRGNSNLTCPKLNSWTSTPPSPLSVNGTTFCLFAKATNRGAIFANHPASIIRAHPLPNTADSIFKILLRSVHITPSARSHHLSKGPWQLKSTTVPSSISETSWYQEAFCPNLREFSTSQWPTAPVSRLLQHVLWFQRCTFPTSSWMVRHAKDT